jgi:hypothetical protein
MFFNQTVPRVVFPVADTKSEAIRLLKAKQRHSEALPQENRHIVSHCLCLKLSFDIISCLVQIGLIGIQIPYSYNFPLKLFILAAVGKCVTPSWKLVFWTSSALQHRT